MLQSMCVVSFIGDQWGRDFPNRWPQVPVPYVPYSPSPNPAESPHKFEPVQDALRECVHCGQPRDHYAHALFETLRKDNARLTKKEFEALRKEIEELKKLLLAAKAFDEATGQPDCEMDEKVALIRQIADLVGVDVDEVFGVRDE